MRARLRLALLCLGLLLALPLALAACGGDGKQAITGQIVAVDAAAKTFSVQAADGKKYDFRVKAGSDVDIVHVKEHMDNKKEIKVEYSGANPPYEASYAH